MPYEGISIWTINVMEVSHAELKMSNLSTFKTKNCAFTLRVNHCVIYLFYLNF